MKKIEIYDGLGDPVAVIEAPEDKSMVFDAGLLQHGVLSIGEYGQSGQKIAAFNQWAYAIFDAGGAGYKVVLRDARP